MGRVDEELAAQPTISNSHTSIDTSTTLAWFGVAAACLGLHSYSRGRPKTRRPSPGGPRGVPSLPSKLPGPKPRMGSSCPRRLLLPPWTVHRRLVGSRREVNLLSSPRFQCGIAGENLREAPACGLAAPLPQLCDQTRRRGLRWVSQLRAFSLNQKGSRAMLGSRRGEEAIGLRLCRTARGRGRRLRRRRRCIHSQQGRLRECLPIHHFLLGS